MNKFKVYYDGACPICRRDRRWYEKLAGRETVTWFDITGRDDYLKQKGIDPEEAKLKLHLEDSKGAVINDIEAYILLLSEIRLFKPLSWLLALKLVREPIRKAYRRSVIRRLEKEGRI